MGSPDFEEVRRFFESEGMLYEQYDFETLLKDFLDDMTAGLEGGTSSLAMLPTYYAVPESLPGGEDVAAIDAGGTRLRRGVLCPTDVDPEIHGFAETAMPGTGGEIGKEEFLDALASFVAPALEPDRRIGFCFSYPAKHSREQDARVVSMTKELKIRDLIGTYIGHELLLRLKALGATKRNAISVVNDSIALFFAGRRESLVQGTGKMDRILQIGYILGTGTNCCYLEPDRNIAAVRDRLSQGSQLINIESGGFEKIRKGPADEELEKLSAGGNRYTLEKMTAGAYLGPLFHEVLKRAADCGLFGKTTGAGIRQIPALETRDVSEVLEHPGTSRLADIVTGESELRRGIHLATLLMERAALLAALPVAAVIERSLSVYGSGAFSGVEVSAEGSTLFRVPGYRENLQRYIDAYLRRYDLAPVMLRHVRNGSLIGAGFAAVSDSSGYSGG